MSRRTAAELALAFGLVAVAIVTWVLKTLWADGGDPLTPRTCIGLGLAIGFAGISAAFVITLCRLFGSMRG